MLAGGQYDRLMERMGRSASGLGFAVYLDRLEDTAETEEYDVDVLLLYDDAARATEAMRRLLDAGRSVSAQRSCPEKLRFREILDLRGGAADA